MMPSVSTDEVNAPAHARVQLPKGIEILHPEELYRDPTVLTVIFSGEDHTMSNLLKHVIAPMPGVEFVGGGETHPLENRMVLRIQTTSADYPAADILCEGFRTISKMFGSIEKTFSSSYEKYAKEAAMS